MTDSKAHVTRNGKTMILDIHQKNLDALCSGVLFKAELVNDKITHLTEEISKQSVEGTAWLLLTPYRKM